MNTEETELSDSKNLVVTKKKKPIGKEKKLKVSDDPFVIKITPKTRKNIELSLKKVKGIVNHIQNVQDNALLLGERLIDMGHVDLGVRVISNAFQHNTSKFTGIEWDNMAPGVPLEADDAKAKLKLAIHNHNVNNLHHPEAWLGGIKSMSMEHLAELSCDWKSRSEEFGTDLRVWIDEKATKRWGFEKSDQVYKDIMRFVDIICDKPFSAV